MVTPVSFARSNGFAQASWSNIKIETNNWKDNLPHSGARASRAELDKNPNSNARNLNVIGSQVNPIRTEAQLKKLVVRLRRDNVMLAPDPIDRLIFMAKRSEVATLRRKFEEVRAEGAQVTLEITIADLAGDQQKIPGLQDKMVALNNEMLSIKQKIDQTKAEGFVRSLEVENQFDRFGATNKLKIMKADGNERYVYVTNEMALLAVPQLVRAVKSKE